MTTSVQSHPVILCGGSGKRLWPLSREHKAKQLIPLTSDDSMLTETLNRLQPLSSMAAPILVANHDQRFMIAEHANKSEVEDYEILLEPTRRDTAPAILCAAYRILEKQSDGIMIVMPSDHYIADKDTFNETIKQAIAAANEGYLVTLGLAPQSPNPNFGYIQPKEAVNGLTKCHIVERFIEKPPAEEAEKLINNSSCFWNSGIFVFKASTLINEAQKHVPKLISHCELAVKASQIDLDFVRLSAPHFEECSSISIDYAVMEPSTQTAVIAPVNMGWSDLGTWQAVYDILPKDENRNVIKGDVISSDTEDCLLFSNDKLLVSNAIKNITVVVEKDAVFVSSKNKSDLIKKIIDNSGDDQRKEFVESNIVNRPWGWYETILMGTNFQVKRINVKPKKRLSLQRHFHRSEHWVVVTGEATVTHGENVFTLHPNQSTYIPKEEVHRLENKTDQSLEIIEIQTGDILSEDDIERLSDDFDRTEG